MSTSRMTFENFHDMERKIADLQEIFSHVEVYNVGARSFDYAYI